jgi:hypothetical protein
LLAALQIQVCAEAGLLILKNQNLLSLCQTVVQQASLDLHQGSIVFAGERLLCLDPDGRWGSARIAQRTKVGILQNRAKLDDTRKPYDIDALSRLD